MIGYLQDNMTWIKDSGTLLFSFIATILAILTYLRARDSILQPFRVEVVKKQTEILSDVLKYVANDKTDLIYPIDYKGIIQVNILGYLKSAGFIFEDDKKVEEILQKNTAGLMPCIGVKQLNEVELVKTFKTKKSDADIEKERREIGRKKYELAKAGEVKIETIYLTHQHQMFLLKMSEFTDNPLLPKIILSALQGIMADVYTNIGYHMRPILEENIKEIVKRSLEPHDKNSELFSIDGIHNSFNRVRIFHKDRLRGLNLVIRKYLKVDSMP